MKTIKWIRDLSFISLLFLNACSSADIVSFGTHTVYGLDIDTKPIPTLSVGMDRSELVVAPRYANGAIPPVIAAVKNRSGWFDTSISQSYATGSAAETVTEETPRPPSKDEILPLKGDKTYMVFGTNTNFGLKASFVGNVPKGLNLGYKRQELSIIPVGHDKDNDLDTYGSVLASVDIHAKLIGSVDIGYASYIATGSAARKMAAIKEVSDAFKTEGKKPFQAHSSYGGGPSSDKLRKFWKPDGVNSNTANKAKIKEWMKKNGLRTDPGDMVKFLHKKRFSNLRDMAAQDLGL